MMKTKLTLFVTVLAVALFGMGCAQLKEVVVKPFTKGKSTDDPLRKGLVAYYPFNGNAKDKSGKGNDGDVKGATLAKDRHGKADSAYSFDGVDDHIYIPSSAALKEMKAVSVSVWVSINEKQKVGAHGYNSFVSRWNGDKGRVASFWVGSNQNTRVAADGAPCHDGQARVRKEYNINGWLHVTYVHDPAGATLFLNGERVVNNNVGRNKLNVADEPLIIGATRGGEALSQFSNGLIDDVRIYSRALSANEVKALYDLEKPKTK